MSELGKLGCANYCTDAEKRISIGQSSETEFTNVCTIDNILTWSNKEIHTELRIKCLSSTNVLEFDPLLNKRGTERLSHTG